MEALLVWVTVFVVLLVALIFVKSDLVRVTAGAFFIVALWAMWGMHGAAFVASLWPSGEASSQTDVLQRLGQAGDLFGGVNALFAALAFAGVAVAAVIQNRSLLLARRQHAQQAFEPLFFHLLELQRGISSNTMLMLPPEMDANRLRPSEMEFDAAVGQLRDYIPPMATQIPPPVATSNSPTLSAV